MNALDRYHRQTAAGLAGARGRRRMGPSSLFFVGLAFAILGSMAQPGVAQTGDVSPFLPPNSGRAADGQGDAGGLELRGIMSTAHGMRYCIYDPAKKISRWVAENQGDFGFVVQSFDSEHDSVVVNQDGRRLTLALREAKVTIGTGPSMAGGPVQPPSPGMPSAILRPTPEDEQKRLQAIAEEVRRRRLLREQQLAAPNPPRQQ